jgi:Xaa-Pro aminopeptidase
VTDVLIVGDTLRSPELRHELPIAIGDPFLYAEHDGRRIVLTNVLEADRLAAAAPEVERLLGEELGRGELIAQGLPRHEVELEVLARAVERVGVRSALVPPGFPVAVADLLRARGVELDVDHEGFDLRRRRKTEAELAGIRRATEAGLASLAEAARVLREAHPRDGVLEWEGEVLTSERLRARLAELCGRLGATLPPDVIVATMGPGDAIGHESGSGPLKPDTPICFDLWPQDDASGCWTDMTRTFVVGEVSDAVGDLHRLVREAHERSLEQLRAGAVAEASYDAACDVFEAAGHPTQRTARPGESLTHGFYFSLGHGVGLEVHEAPLLSRKVATELVAGDVLAVEPGLVVPGLGGMRVEDLVLVGDDGAENLTGAAPDDLRP